MDTETPTTFYGWAVVEIMGHQTFAGYVTQENHFGTSLLRIDVPEVPATTEMRNQHRQNGYGYDKVEVLVPAVAAFTRYFGGSSLYGLTPCTEEVAQAAYKKLKKTPISVVYLPELSPPETVLQKLLPERDGREPEDSYDHEWFETEVPFAEPVYEGDEE